MNDLKELGDRLQELASPPGGRSADDIFDTAVGGSSDHAQDAPRHRRHSALLVAAALVLVAGFGSWRMWGGDDAKLVTTPAGPTEAPPKPPDDQSGPTSSSAVLSIDERLADFRPDIPAREVPLAQPLTDDELGLSDDEIANMKWLISTMSPEDAQRELGELVNYLNSSLEEQEKLLSKSVPQSGERSILTVPGIGAGWLEVDPFGHESVNSATGRGIVYRSSTGDEPIGEYDGRYYFPADSSERIETRQLAVFDD